MKKIVMGSVFLFMFLALLSANSIAMTVDFRDYNAYGQYLQGQNETSFHSAQDSLTLNAESGNAGSAYLTWYSDDGIGGGGTASYEEDEWEGVRFQGDYLKIEFDASVYLTHIYLTDFFWESRGDHWYAEEGDVKFLLSGNEISTNHFMQLEQPNISQSWPSNGEYTIDVAALTGSVQLVDEIWLAGIGIRQTNTIMGENCTGFIYLEEDHEFAVAGLDFTPVPEPASMFLLGTGFIGLAIVGRKRLIKK
jgi:hypothetical protein